MIVTKQIEGWGNVWYDDSNADMENMFKPLKSAAVEDQEEEEESAFITLKRAMFGEIK
jgi:hypothetical protein